MVTKEDFKKDIEHYRYIKSLGKLSKAGLQKLKVMEKYKNLILLDSSLLLPTKD